MKITSNARWPTGTLVGQESQVTTDEEVSAAAAIAACRLLNTHGFGGEGEIFPIETWIDEFSDRGEIKSTSC